MKIVFFGNSDFSVLPMEELIKNFEVVGVITAPESRLGRGQKTNRLNPVKEIALKYGIPILQPEKLRNNQEFHEQLKNIGADLHVIVSYGKIIPKDMITIPQYETINLHASLLPKLRGAAPIQYALWQGLEHTGNTVQFITEGMDEGDIIGQSILTIESDDDYSSLEKKLSQNGAELLRECITQIKLNQTKRIKQNSDHATYTKLITKEDGEIFFSMNAEDIVNAFRAFKVKPGIFVSLEIGLVKILECYEGSREIKEKEGKILDISEKGILVSCYEGSIYLKQLQATGKKAVSGKDFANGNRLKTGTLLL